MLKQYFVKQGLKEARIEGFIKNRFPQANYSHMDLQRTPLGIKVIIYSSSPGRIIGRRGVVINELTDALREKFALENPQIDVKSVPNPYLDAKIVSKQIVLALERGFNFKRMGNIMLKKVMSAGAIGVEIIIKGKMTGGKGMTAKFLDGYLKHSGSLSKELVDYGYADLYTVGRSKPGKIGVKVKIMKEFQSISGERRKTLKEIPKEEPKKEDESKETKKEETKEQKPEKKKLKPKETKKKQKTKDTKTTKPEPKKPAKKSPKIVKTDKPKSKEKT